MRRKVEEMQRQLLERKNKLRATEDTAEKKGNVVDKVNKILNMKVMVASFLIVIIICLTREVGLFLYFTGFSGNVSLVVGETRCVY